MALENLKKEMLANVDQYKSFVETESEGLDAYTTALNTNESNFIFNIQIMRSPQFICSS